MKMATVYLQTTSFWIRCSSSSSLSQRPFSTVKAERRCSSNSPLVLVMGALMVVDPQPTARYQPARLYINRGAPKNRGWWERGRTERNRSRGKFWSINQQHLVLLPPLSSSWTEKTGQNTKKRRRKKAELRLNREGDGRRKQRGKTQGGERRRTEKKTEEQRRRTRKKSKKYTQ